jgi:hypothetical protein
MKITKIGSVSEIKDKRKILENGAFTGINDYVISFEPPYYFTKLVGRVLKLFIPKA